MKPYVGIKENCKPEIFESEPLPDKTHPNMTLFMDHSIPEKMPKDTSRPWAI